MDDNRCVCFCENIAYEWGSRKFLQADSCADYFDHVSGSQVSQHVGENGTFPVRLLQDMIATVAHPKVVPGDMRSIVDASEGQGGKLYPR